MIAARVLRIRNTTIFNLRIFSSGLWIIFCNLWVRLNLLDITKVPDFKLLCVVWSNLRHKTTSLLTSIHVSSKLGEFKCDVIWTKIVRCTRWNNSVKKSMPCCVHRFEVFVCDLLIVLFTTTSTTTINYYQPILRKIFVEFLFKQRLELYS